VVEYASADAVRRGGGDGHKPKKTSTDGPGKGHARSKSRDSAVGDDAKKKGNMAIITTPSKPQEENNTAVSRRGGISAKSKSNHGMRKSRPAPGAALALAKREQVAIVPSQGRRKTFDDD